jgi:hypothetical protein
MESNKDSKIEDCHLLAVRAEERCWCTMRSAQARWANRIQQARAEPEHAVVPAEAIARGAVTKSSNELLHSSLPAAENPLRRVRWCCHCWCCG